MVSLPHNLWVGLWHKPNNTSIHSICWSLTHIEWVLLSCIALAFTCIGTACSSGGFRWLRIICKELASKIQIIIRAFLSVPPRKLFTYPWWVTHSEVSWLVSPFGLKPFYIDTPPPPSQLELILTRRDIRDGSAALVPSTQVGTSGQCTYQASPSNN